MDKKKIFFVLDVIALFVSIFFFFYSLLVHHSWPFSVIFFLYTIRKLYDIAFDK